MNNFKGGGFKKGAPKFGGKKKFTDNKKFGGGHGRDTRATGADTEMFSATCSDCGKNCNVPFRPSSEKPVYCSECFGMKKSANEPRGSKHAEKRSHTPTHTSNHTQNNTNAANNTRGIGNDVITDLKRQITGLEVKLNKILDLINPPLPAKKAELSQAKTETPKAEKKVVAKKVSPKKTAVKKAVKQTAPAATKNGAVKRAAKKVAEAKTTKKTK